MTNKWWLRNKQSVAADAYKLISKVDDSYSIASSAGEAVIIGLARRILTDDPLLEEFIMAMGTAHFTVNEEALKGMKGDEELLGALWVSVGYGRIFPDATVDIPFISDQGEIIRCRNLVEPETIFPNSRQEIILLGKFLQEWDEAFKFTGIGIRFTKDGEVCWSW